MRSGARAPIAGRAPPAWRWAAVDLSALALHCARRHCPPGISLDVANICRLPMAQASFVLVICSEVLEHRTDVTAALAEVMRVSRGHVLITGLHEPLCRVLARLAVWLRLGPDPGHKQS